MYALSARITGPIVLLVAILSDPRCQPPLVGHSPAWSLIPT
jgi:hypothetical protein